MGWAGHVERLGKRRGAHRILVGKPEGKWPLRKIILKFILKKSVGWAPTGFIQLRRGTRGGIL
jgi:hypothetical protein